MTLRFRRNRSTATTSQRAAIRLYLRKARLFRGASRAYERDYLDAAAALGRYSPAELIGFARQLDPVGSRTRPPVLTCASIRLARTH